MHLISLLLIVSLYGGHFVCAQQHDSHEDEEMFSEPSTQDLWIAIGITSIAGAAAFIGAFSICSINKDQIGTVAIALSFSSGVLIYLIFFNLIPESLEKFNDGTDLNHPALSHLFCLCCVVLGVLMTLSLEYSMKTLGIHDHGDGHGQDVEDQSDDKDECGGLSKETVEGPKSPKPTDLSHLSFSVALALILHHFPEGIATFISLYNNLSFGAVMAFGLAIHDIPSGICIAVPTYCSTGSMLQPFMLCLCAAIVYPFGALIGWTIIETQSEHFVDLFMAILFGITAGIMLYIAFVELLPTAIITAYNINLLNPKKKRNMVSISIALLFVGFLLMDSISILMAAIGGHEH